MKTKVFQVLAKIHTCLSKLIKFFQLVLNKIKRILEKGKVHE